MIDTKLKIRKMLPRGTSVAVSDRAAEIFENLENDTGIVQEYMEEMVSRNINIVTGKGNLSIERYLDAIKYVSLKKRMSNFEAWKKTFPDRYNRMVDKGHDDKTISASVAAYNTNWFIVDIEAQMILDFSIYYHWARHEAMMKNIDLMRGIAAPTQVPRKIKDPDTGKMVIVRDDNGEPIYDEIRPMVSATVQQVAAAKILDITAPPEEKNITLKLGMSDEAVEAQRETSDAMRALAEQMREALENGASIEDVQVIGHVLESRDE